MPETKKYVAEFGLPPKECGGNFRGHTNSKGKRERVRMYRAMCGMGWRRAGIPPLITEATPGRKVVLHLEFYLSKRLTKAGQVIKDGCYRPKDEDSARHSFKAGQDALKDVGIIPDDHSKYLKAGDTTLYTRRDTHKGETKVVATLEVIEESNE